MTIKLDGLNLRKSEKRDFGSDHIGKIAGFMADKLQTAKFWVQIPKDARRFNKEIGEARASSQREWAKAVRAIKADDNLISILDEAGLLESLNKATGIIMTEYEPYSDDGGSTKSVAHTLAEWAADEFYPREWGAKQARNISEALNRVGVIDSDQSKSLRASIVRQRKKPQPDKVADLWFSGKLR